MDPNGGWSFRAEDVTKVFNDSLRANDGITLHRPGEVYGLPVRTGPASPRWSSR